MLTSGGRMTPNNGPATNEVFNGFPGIQQAVESGKIVRPKGPRDEFEISEEALNSVPKRDEMSLE